MYFQFSFNPQFRWEGSAKVLRFPHFILEHMPKGIFFSGVLYSSNELSLLYLGFRLITTGTVPAFSPILKMFGKYLNVSSHRSNLQLPSKEGLNGGCCNGDTTGDGCAGASGGGVDGSCSGADGVDGDCGDGIDSGADGDDGDCGDVRDNLWKVVKVFTFFNVSPHTSLFLE